MRKSQFNHTPVAKILKEFEQGKSPDEINREYGVSKATFYKWCERYGGIEANEEIINKCWVNKSPVWVAHTKIDYR